MIQSDDGAPERHATEGTPADDGPDWSFLWKVDFEGKLRNHWNKMLWRAFSALIPRGASILEVGTGSGKIALQAARDLEAKSVGIDVDPRSVYYARELGRFVKVAATFVCASGFAVPFSNDTFDVVLSEGVIEHFTRGQTAQMVAEHARVCRPGGRVLVAVPNLLNPVLTYHKLRTGKNYHAYPERSYTIWGLARLLQQHGLRPIAFSGFAPTVGLEWFIHKRLRFHWLDRRTPSWLLALVGHEVLVATEKEA